MPDKLKRRQASEPAADEMTNQLFEKQIVNHAREGSLVRVVTCFVGQTKRQLVKGQEMNVEE